MEEEKTSEDWADELQPDVAYCTNCQPFEGGEPIWVMGIRRSMLDFLFDYEVPEELQGAVAEQLFCNNCGTELDTTYDIGTKTPYETAADERWKEWKEKHEPALAEFTASLEEYPYLGVGRLIGQQILGQIADFPKATHLAESWWRARPVKSPTPLTTDEMGPPPKPPSTEGRYNHHGQRVFYLASSKEAAAAEVLGGGETLVWLQEFSVTGLNKILDLTDPHSWEDYGDKSVPLLAVGLNWSGAHMEPDDPESEWKPQYFLPRFIADCARRAGFSGILFVSPRHYDTNLVLFDWTTDQIKPCGDPGLLEMTKRPTDVSDGSMVDF